MSFDILDIVELRSQRVIDVDNNDLPVGLLLVEKGHNAEDLDLLDLARLGNELANLADVQRVVVSLGLGLWVDNVGVFPGLYSQSTIIRKVRVDKVSAYLREGTVVPKVALVREAVPHISELALLDVLLDRVESFLLANL